ncbi:hypothetical protein NBRC116601_19130 [Cognatishimia sp. WU-CL00825]
MLLGKQTQCGWRPLHEIGAAAEVTLRLINGQDTSDIATAVVQNGVGADVAFRLFTKISRFVKILMWLQTCF